MNRDKRLRMLRKRDAHHLWSAERGEDDKIKVVRSKVEPEMFEHEKEKETMKEVASACWGLWGASLVDDRTLTNDIPSGIVARLNKVAAESLARGKASSRVYTWDQLRRAFGNRVIDEVRKSISDGMYVRMASKYLNVPFIVAAELLDRFGSENERDLKSMVQAVKGGRERVAMKKFGSKVKAVQRIYRKYSRTGMYKLAVDEVAAEYWRSYFGPFGSELVREIKRRVRADIAGDWLRKNGVDEKAKEYWSVYFSGGYGDDLVKDLAKKLSPK